MTISKKTQILNAALNLFTVTGFHNTSTAAIAREAGVATGTLFHHFPSKELLIAALYQDIKHEFAAVLSQQLLTEQGDAAFAAIWTNGVSWLVMHPQKLAFILLCSHSLYFDKSTQMDIWQQELGFVSDMLMQGIADGRIKDLPIDYLMTVCESLLLSTSTYVSSLPETDRALAIKLSINVIVDAISQADADLI